MLGLAIYVTLRILNVFYKKSLPTDTCVHARVFAHVHEYVMFVDIQWHFNKYLDCAFYLHQFIVCCNIHISIV